MSSDQVIYRKRRGIELVGVLFAALLGIGGYLMTHLNREGALPDNTPTVVVIWLAVCLGAHLAVRWRTPYAGPVLLPTVLALNGMGLAMIHRIDLSQQTDGANSQLLWTILGVVLFVVVLWLVRDYRILHDFPYLLFLVGMVLLMLPLVPGLASPNNQLNGSQIWIQLLGYSFQPAEVSKIVLTVAFASYLADSRDLLQLAGHRIGNFNLPRLRDLLPILVMWGAALVVLVFENDLGTSLLFFGLFVMMLFVATSQVRWVVIAGIMFGAAAVAIAKFVPHVQTRISSWLHPFSNYDANYQIIQAQYGMAWGGLFGRGWGLGRPQQIPVASSDFISAAIGEELGFVGLIAVILLYFLLVSRGMKVALTSQDIFGKLLASGLSFVIALQVFSIIGGVTRLLPLTGLTTPFMSQGGSSLIANWVIIALLLQVSHQARRPRLNEPNFGNIVNLANERTQIIDVGKISDAAKPVPAPNAQVPDSHTKDAQTQDSHAEADK